MRGRVVVFILAGVLALCHCALLNKAIAQVTGRSGVPAAAACCVGARGDVDTEGGIDITDLTHLIDGLYVSYAPFSCPEAANVNADPSGIVDMGDIYSLTDYLFLHFQVASCTQVKSVRGIDHGVQDSIFLSPQSFTVDSLGVAHLSVGVYLFNDADSLSALSCGFSWDYASTMSLDSAVGTTDFWDSNSGSGRFGVVRSLYKKNSKSVSNADRQFVIAGCTNKFLPQGGLPPSATPYLLATYYFTLQNWTPVSHVCFELSEINAGATAEFVNYDQSIYRPRVSGLVTVHAPGFVNTPPVLTPVGTQSTLENQPLVFGVQATDVDGDCLKLNVTNLPIGAALVDSGNGSGVVTWTPNCRQQGNYPILVHVFDGTDAVTDSALISVLPTTCPPIVSAGSVPVFVEGKTDSIVITATSPEGDCVQFNGITMPAGSFFSENSCQHATFRWTPSVGQAGVYHVGFAGYYSFMSSTARPDAVDTQYVDITVIIDSSEIPIQVLPSTVNFVATEGGPAPAGRTLQIIGPPGKTWVKLGGSSWNSLNHSSGFFPDSVLLTVDPIGLPAGNYGDTLLFRVNDTIGASSQYVGVGLTVNSPPEFTVSPPQVNFSCKVGEDGTLSQKVIIEGSAGLRWSLAATPPWMYFSRDSGTVPDTIFAFQFGCTNQLTPGGDFAEIPFTATDTINTLNDTLQVTWNILDGVFFVVQPEVVPAFAYTKGGPLPPAHSVEIGSPLGYPYPWHVSARPSWIVVQPDTGHLPEGSNPSEHVLVSIVDSGLLPGSVYQGTVVFTAENLPLYGTQSINVSVVVDSGADLSLSRNRLGFFHEVGGPLPDPQRIVMNGSTGSAWSLRKAGTWMAVNKSSGVLPDTLEVTVPGASQLDSGVYLGNIAVSLNDSTATTKSIDVSLHVSPAVEVGSSAVRAGQIDSIPIFISHDTIAGFFIPLSYANSELFRRPNSTGIHFDSIRIEQYYLDLGTTYEIDSGNQIIIVQCPARKPPIQPPDTGKSTKLAEMYYSIDQGSASSIVTIDTTSTACPIWDETGSSSCGIRYYREDGTTIVPQFEAGKIIIISATAPKGVTGQLTCSPDTVTFGLLGEGDSAQVVVSSIGIESMAFDLSGLTCFTASPSSGVTPAEVWITGMECDHPETMIVTSPSSVASVEVPVRGLLSVQIRRFDPGWNLVSWNVGSTSDSLESIFGPYLSCIDVILSYDRGGLTYDPALPDFSTLRNVGVTAGYWVKVKPDCGFNITFAGDSVDVTQPIILNKGYNLVGYLPKKPLDIELALGSVLAPLEVVYTFDSGIQIFRPNMGSFNSLTMLKPGNGYWLKMTDGDTLVYPGPTAIDNYTMSSLPPGATTGAQPQGTAGAEPPLWVNLYSHELTLDGKMVGAGHIVTAHDAETGLEIGRGELLPGGKLALTPVYGKPGAKFYVAIDGKVDSSRLTWSELGERIEIHDLTTENPPVSGLPSSFALDQNHPNPFNLTTVISFDVPKRSRVKIEAFDVLGRRVSTLVDKIIEAGSHALVWEARNDHGDDLASGVYFIRMSTDTFVGARKVVLLK